MTIGAILETLKDFNDDDRIELNAPSLFLSGEFGSYRGYYDQIHLSYSYSDEGFNTVGDLKKILLNALKQGVMWGYKGGEYPILITTPVWLALDYGDCSDSMISSISRVGDVVVVYIEKDYY